MLGHDQSMYSAAVRHGFRCALNKSVPIRFGLVWVGSGQIILWPSRLATMNSRLRMVGAE
jgi:hypothetical protein